MRARVAASGIRDGVLEAAFVGRGESLAGAGFVAPAGARGVASGGVGAFAATFFAQPEKVRESAVSAAQAKNRDFIQSLLSFCSYRIQTCGAAKESRWHCIYQGHYPNTGWTRYPYCASGSTLEMMWFRPAAELIPKNARYTGGRMRQRPGVVLVVGFGGLLLIMAAAEAGAWLFLNSLRHNDAALQSRFLARNRTLERIRSNIYQSGTFVRDSLLAPEQSGARAQLATLQGLRRDSERALASYAAALEPEE